MAKKKILLIDDDVDICTLLKRFLERKGYEVFICFRGKEGVLTLEKYAIDLVLTDFRLPDIDGLELIQKMKEVNRTVPIIVITGYSDVKQAVKVIQLGAYEYVTKPIFPEEIVLHIEEAIKKSGSELSQNEQEETKVITAEKKDKSDNSFQFIVGSSATSKAIQKQIKLVAPTDMTVVILGESGTGKEVAARRIHENSNRKSKPFLAVDCGALPQELAASELFGHVKGAFTGAVADKKGQFELANGGTLFLDEIGNLSYENQVKLLRVLQERKIRRVGSEKDMQVDVRIIAATNEDLKESMDKGSFREDIYFRLNEFKIELPALRENRETIEEFAYHFLNEANQFLNKNVKAYSKEVIAIFKNYDWPGNIRELKNVIRRAVLLTTNDIIDEKALPHELKTSRTKGDLEEKIKFQTPLKTSLEDEIVPFSVQQKEQVRTLKEEVQDFEVQVIEKTLKLVDYNKTKCAELLGIKRKTLYNKIAAYGINLNKKDE